MVRSSSTYLSTHHLIHYLLEAVIPDIVAHRSLRSTPDYPTMKVRLGSLHLLVITLALLVLFHAPDEP